MTKLLYIGGYGRSGSTLLELLLAASPDVVACGEIVIAARRQNAPRCSCGKSREDCALWGRVFTQSHPPGSWSHKNLTLALLREVQGRFAVLLDSSKTAWGSFRTPFVARRSLGQDLLLLHIVRDPRGVCWSNVSGKRRRNGRRLPDIQHSPVRFARHVRTLIGWWAANLASEVFGWRYPNQYARVRYETLVQAPDKTVTHIFATFALGAAPHFRTNPATDNRHQLFGSRVRFRSPSPEDIRPDTRWRTEMRWTDRWMISALSWPLRWRYGY